jgi:hypothetical protein
VFHDDLTLYTRKEYRSSYYLEKCWSLLEEKFLFFIGFLKEPSISIYLESDNVTLVVSNKDRVYYNESIKKNFSHSLNVCEEFIVSILIDNNQSNKTPNRCVYSFAKDTCDEGIVEFIGSYNMEITNYETQKNDLFLRLCLEIQYAINKNIFSYNINKNFNKPDIDSHYELATLNAKINKTNFSESLEQLAKNNLVPSNIYNKILKLNKVLEKQNV